MNLARYFFKIVRKGTDQDVIRGVDFMIRYLAAVALAASLSLASSAQAALMFVGYWDVADPGAPGWADNFPTGPIAYTAQEAAAYLFGGIASDYSISTVDDTVANINNLAWYDVIGYGGSIFAEDYSSKYLGQFYGPTIGFSGDETGAASAFVRDNLTQGVERNYAFIDDGTPDPNNIPAPSIVPLFLLGLTGIAAARRRKNVSA